MLKIVSELEFRWYDKNGILERILKKPADSLIRQFVDTIRCEWEGTSTTTIKDTGGFSRSESYTQYFRTNAAAADVNFGILVGTGTNAVTISDFQLQTKIANGTGSGQLLYQATVISAVTVVGSDAYITVSRNFNNNSGASITIQEVGLAVRSGLGYYYQISRDLTGGHEVLDGKTYAAQYTLKVTA